jgi:dienelactone hydrolase
LTLSPDFIQTIIRATPLRMAFTPAASSRFDGWSNDVRAKLRELLKLDELNAIASRTPVRGEVVSREQCDGFVREKVMVDDGPFGPIPTFVLTPNNLEGPAPAVLCLHGHGGYHAGKDMVAGATDTHPIAIECAEALNYGYGVQLAKAGYITICPDAYGFGERMLEADRWTTAHLCDAYNHRLTLTGFSHCGVSVHGNQRLIDYALGLPNVAGDVVGCVGLSYGGHQTQILAVVEPRVHAAVVSGSLSSAAGTLGDACGSQAVPGMAQWFDTPDIAIAVAPRAVMYELMEQDCCFDFKKAMELYKRISEAFKAVGAGEQISLDTADTDHRYIGNKVPAFFDANLRPACAVKV